MAGKHKPGAGHPINIEAISVEEIPSQRHAIERIFAAQSTGIIIRNAMPEDMVKTAVERMTSPSNDHLWASPNRGMAGGEIRTIGDAATPTYTAFRGPDSERYSESAARHDDWVQALFGEENPTQLVANLLGGLYQGRPASPPPFQRGRDWLPFNYRALDPGVQIYSHHDNHYGLAIYEQMGSQYSRDHLLSWFITLQPAQIDGNLVIYGLWGSDPDPPMLPTRFLDTAALERDYGRFECQLGAGDLVVFDSGRHVHRVTPVGGELARLTLGGFLTKSVDQSQLAFWS